MIPPPTIPLLFFDIIGRIVPGGVALLVWYLTAPSGMRERSGALLLDLGIGAPASSLASAVVWVGAAYVVGHLMSPFAKFITWALRRVFGEGEIGGKAPLSNWFVRSDGSRAGLIPREPWSSYDWLRVHGAHVSDFATRIRAEYTLHFALSATFMVGALLTLTSSGERSIGATIRSTAGLLGLALLCAWRGAELTKSFCTLVRNLEAALKEPARTAVPAKGDSPSAHRP